MESKRQYDYSISLLRIISMLFIITCHISSHYNNVALAQFFNVGVPIFALISGYLYGGKDTEPSADWLIKRYIRLEMPIIMWAIITTVLALIKNTNTPTWYQYIFLLFDLQGLNFILTGINDIFVGPWFFTSIMGCYLALFAYKKIEKRHPKISRIFAGGVPSRSLYLSCLG